jgi:hypothetical protein
MTEKQEAHKEKRNLLIQLSAQAKEIQLLEIETGEDDRNINSILIDDFYTDSKNQTFNTFHEWLNQGFKVKKGEKAFLVWGRKRKNNQDQENKEPKTEAEKVFSFYPLCYLFSNAQVEPIKKATD